MILTIETLLDAMRKVKEIETATPFGSLRVIEAHSALAETTERLFPESRHRSARILKKLIKRHGGEFRKEPAVFRVGDTIYAHPAHYRELTTF